MGRSPDGNPMFGLMHSSQPQSPHAHSGAQVGAGAMGARSGRQSRQISVQGFFLARSRKACVTAGDHRHPRCGRFRRKVAKASPLNCILSGSELHTELAAQSLRKIPHVASSSASKLTTTGPQKPVLLPRFDVEFTANSIATAHTSR